MAPSLSATAKKLERTIVQNQVSHLLETRPEKDELVTQHILDGACCVEPSRAKCVLVTHEFDANVVTNAGTENSVAPMLQGAKHQLERQLKVDQVARQLRKRPSINELEEKGIIEGAGWLDG